jgi:hypothetical protein
VKDPVAAQAKIDAIEKRESAEKLRRQVKMERVTAELEVARKRNEEVDAELRLRQSEFVGIEIKLVTQRLGGLEFSEQMDES